MKDQDKYATAIFQNLNEFVKTIFDRLESEQPEMLQKIEYVLNENDCDLIAQIVLGTDDNRIRIYFEDGYEQRDIATFKYKTLSKH
jgi:hypothetical protein